MASSFSRLTAAHSHYGSKQDLSRTAEDLSFKVTHQVLLVRCPADTRPCLRRRHRRRLRRPRESGKTWSSFGRDLQIFNIINSKASH